MFTYRIFRPLFYLAFFLGLTPVASFGQEVSPPVPPATSKPGSATKVIRPQLVLVTRLEEARQLCWNGDYRRAATLYTEIIASGRDVAAAYAGLAHAYLKMRKVDDAYKAASKAVELDPSLAAAHAALGDVYFRQGKLYEAEQEYLTPLRAKNEDAQAYLGLSRIYYTTFNENRAKIVLDRAHTLDPKDPDISSDWVQTRPAAEQIRALEAFIAAGGHGEHVGRAGARQWLAVLKDQALHPDRTCQMVNKLQSAQINLEPLFNMSRGASASDRIYPGVGVDARLNGFAARLVVETSSDRIILNQKTAEKAGAQQVVRTEIEGVGDENPPEGYTAYVESIKFGEIEFKGCYVTVIEDASPRNFLGDHEGAVGAGIFANYLVDLDLRHSKLRLTGLPPYPDGTPETVAEKGGATEPCQFHDRYIAPEMVDWTALYRSNQLLLLPVYANGATAKLFGVSLGSGISLISLEAAHEVSTVTSDQFTHVRGLNGEVKNGHKSGPLKLQFAGLEFHADALPVADMSIYDENSFEVSGLLGFPVLKYFNIQIDYRDGLIYLDHGEKRK
jgi:tetratricopeptide (TPR) repeat protein